MSRSILVSMLFCALGLTACATLGSASLTLTETVENPAATSTPPVTITPTPVGTASTLEQCAYMWGTRALPQLSQSVNLAMQALQPEATGQARAYGENCVYADGHAVFSTMETDFYVTYPVKSLKNDADLGDRIKTIMQAIGDLPRDSIPGPQPGFVEVTFKSGDDQRILRVDIRKYRALSPDLSGSDLMKALFPNP